MAKVYSGKVAIPGDKIDEYFKIIAEAEKKREPFRQSLLDLVDEFYEYLRSKFTDRTAHKHSNVVELFVEFICRQTDVQKIEEITKGMVNTHFNDWWERKVWDSNTPNDLRIALKKFFAFLAEAKGIENDRVRKALR